MKLMIVGSGYVGLVAGACFSELGHDVVCVDRDAGKIERLRAGIVPIFEPGLGELMLANTAIGRLTFANDLSGLNNGVDAVFIAVGTPASSIDQSADLSMVFAVARDVARAASSDLVIVTKSTVPVGTGDEIACIMRATAPELRFCVASNPEFLREGNAIKDFMAPDRIVIEVEDDPARDALERVYAPLTERGSPLVSTSRRAAELVKYASNCFLATKISFINELADLCEAVGTDIEEVAGGDRPRSSYRLDIPSGRSRLRRLLLSQRLRRYAGNCEGKQGHAQRCFECCRRQRRAQGHHRKTRPSRSRLRHRGQRRGSARPYVQGRHR